MGQFLLSRGATRRIGGCSRPLRARDRELFERDFVQRSRQLNGNPLGAAHQCPLFNEPVNVQLLLIALLPVVLMIG
jgi:hypothetical protein